MIFVSFNNKEYDITDNSLFLNDLNIKKFSEINPFTHTKK